MKTLIVCLFLTCPSAGYVDSDLYVTKMKETLQLMGQSRTLEESQKVANTFEIIGAAEKDKWLPYYYCAFTYGLMSMQAADAEFKDQYAEKALSVISTGLEIRPGESEMYVLKAFVYYAMIEVDPVARGMEYIGLADQFLAKAEELNRDNPRIYFLRGQTVYHMPPEFGGGIQAALPILKLAKDKYDLTDGTDELNPQWGREETNLLLEQVAAIEE